MIPMLLDLNSIGSVSVQGVAANPKGSFGASKSFSGLISSGGESDLGRSGTDGSVLRGGVKDTAHKLLPELIANQHVVDSSSLVINEEILESIELVLDDLDLSDLDLREYLEGGGSYPLPEQEGYELPAFLSSFLVTAGFDYTKVPSQDGLERLVQLFGSDFQIADYVGDSGQIAWLSMLQRLTGVESQRAPISVGQVSVSSTATVLNPLVGGVADTPIYHPIQGSLPSLGAASPKSVELLLNGVFDLKASDSSGTNASVTQVGTQLKGPTYHAQFGSADMISRESMAQKLAAVLGDKVNVQVATKATDSNATIRLDPPHLGKLTVKMQVEGDRVVVQVSATNNMTRDALRDSTDILRDALQGQFASVDVEVSEGSRDLYSDADGERDDVIASNSLTIGEGEFVQVEDEGILQKV
ncbi:flagellar hook-length control protein FliK [Vibrio parahaemolyticus]|nr:flagellar hook-length control protein FliK [Vibrio parahaemolyticus]